MGKDFENEYLEIISSIQDSSGRNVPESESGVSINAALRNAVSGHTTLNPSNDDVLPKFARTEGNAPEVKRVPLKKRMPIDNRVIQNETLDEEYLDAELPVMKEDVKMSTYVVKELEKTQVIKPITNYSIPVKKKKFSFKKLVSLSLVVCVAFVSVYSATKVSLWNTENEASDIQMDAIKDLIVEKVVAPSTTLEEDGNIVGSAVNLVQTKKIDYAHLSLVDVDFSKLATVNADTIAYMKINGLDVSTPIVQTTDNDFYLNHSFDKTPNSAGWIFGDYRDDWDNLKTNTIVYGHNRMNYAMFGSLKLVFDEKWNKNVENHFIHVSTENSNMVWQIFSAYIIPTETYYLTNGFKTDAEYQEFLDTITDRSTVDFGTDVTTEDKILTLSTCYTDTSKTVIHAKLVKRQYK